MFAHPSVPYFFYSFGILLREGLEAMLVIIALGAVVLSGCRTAPNKVDYARRYPKDAVQGEVLNIQVVRHNTEIEFTNTTARSFGSCTLWLNSRFSRPLDGVKIGQTLRLPLKEFRNEFSDSFRSGGFWATDLPDRLVRAGISHLVGRTHRRMSAAPADRGVAGPWLGRAAAARSRRRGLFPNPSRWRIAG